jgi:hypothetical protein
MQQDYFDEQQRFDPVITVTHHATNDVPTIDELQA